MPAMVAGSRCCGVRRAHKPKASCAIEWHRHQNFRKVHDASLIHPTWSYAPYGLEIYNNARGRGNQSPLPPDGMGVQNKKNTAVRMDTLIQYLDMRFVTAQVSIRTAAKTTARSPYRNNKNPPKSDAYAMPGIVSSAKQIRNRIL